MNSVVYIFIIWYIEVCGDGSFGGGGVSDQEKQMGQTKDVVNIWDQQTSLAVDLLRGSYGLV